MDEGLDSAVADIVERLRTPTESIWLHVAESDDAASVYLIEAAVLKESEPLRAVGLVTGQGRLLHFECKDGKWQLSSESNWIA